MIDVLKSTIKKLENEKEGLRRQFSEYELKPCLDNYIELRALDKTINILKEMLINELEKAIDKEIETNEKDCDWDLEDCN